MTNKRLVYILTLVNYKVYQPIIGYLYFMTSFSIWRYMLLRTKFKGELFLPEGKEDEYYPLNQNRFKINLKHLYRTVLQKQSITQKTVLLFSKYKHIFKNFLDLGLKHRMYIFCMVKSPAKVRSTKKLPNLLFKNKGQQGVMCSIGTLWGGTIKHYYSKGPFNSL